MVDAFFYPVTNRAHRTMKMLINDYNLFTEHWRSMAVGIACTSFFLFVVLVGCFLKIASSHRFAGLERATSQIELNPFESSVTEETTLCNDGDQISWHFTKERQDVIMRRNRKYYSLICTSPLKDCLRVRGNVTLQFEGRKKATVNAWASKGRRYFESTP